MQAHITQTRVQHVTKARRVCLARPPPQDDVAAPDTRAPPRAPRVRRPPPREAQFRPHHGRRPRHRRPRLLRKQHAKVGAAGGHTRVQMHRHDTEKAGTRVYVTRAWEHTEFVCKLAHAQKWRHGHM